MKSGAILLILFFVLIVGAGIRYFVHLSKGTARLTDLSNGAIFKNDENLSPIVFAGSYVHREEEVELRFDGEVALVDGEVCTKENRISTIERERQRKKATYFILVAGEKDSFGPLVEAASEFRNLGFRAVILMANIKWINDGYHWPHPEWLRSP